MALSDVQICNLALGHLGDSATVSSIDPPEGSSQAEHCARFYPIARDTMLEMHDWSFTVTRAVLAQVGYTFVDWLYAYALPADAVRIIAVLPSDTGDDYSASFPLANIPFSSVMINQRGIYTPQKFALETDALGNRIILTNQINAMVRYSRAITDTSKFSPLFTDAVARLLASYLAGPVLKGDSGIAQGKAQLAIAMAILGQAGVSDANQQRQDVGQQTPWLVGR